MNSWYLKCFYITYIYIYLQICCFFVRWHCYGYWKNLYIQLKLPHLLPFSTGQSHMPHVTHLQVLWSCILLLHEKFCRPIFYFVKYILTIFLMLTWLRATIHSHHRSRKPRPANQGPPRKRWIQTQSTWKPWWRLGLSTSSPLTCSSHGSRWKGSRLPRKRRPRLLTTSAAFSNLKLWRH